MNCYIHLEEEAIGTCTVCGKPICNECAIEVQGKLVCRTCLASGKVDTTPPTSRDANTAFLIELIGGFFGFLGIGYIYAGRTNDGILRLVLWIIYDLFAAVTISLLLAVFVGIICIPFQLAIQIGVPLWSANSLKNQLAGGSAV
jgi:TM2 domain-containing membrane protein YozV